MIGETLTITGTPAALRARIAASRFSGRGARGSRRRARPGSRVGKRDRDEDEVPRRHLGEDVEVAQDEIGFRGDADGMARLPQHLQHRAGDAVLALHRLIGIGGGAERDRLRTVARRRELAGQQPGRVRLGEDPRLEVEPRRQAEPGMGRAGVAVDAAMLAAAIRVDRPVERDVRRGVAGDDPVGSFSGDPRAQGRRRVDLPVGLVERLAPGRLVTAARVGGRPTAAPGLPGRRAGAEPRR